MDTARSNVNAAYNGGVTSIKVNNVETQQSTIGYDAQYKKYIKMCAEHGLAQMVIGSLVSFYARIVDKFVMYTLQIQKQL